MSTSKDFDFDALLDDIDGIVDPAKEVEETQEVQKTEEIQEVQEVRETENPQENGDIINKKIRSIEQEFGELKKEYFEKLFDSLAEEKELKEELKRCRADRKNLKNDYKAYGLPVKIIDDILKEVKKEMEETSEEAEAKEAWSEIIKTDDSILTKIAQLS